MSENKFSYNKIMQNLNTKDLKVTNNFISSKHNYTNNTTTTNFAVKLTNSVNFKNLKTNNRNQTNNLNFTERRDPMLITNGNNSSNLSAERVFNIFPSNSNNSRASVNKRLINNRDNIDIMDSNLNVKSSYNGSTNISRDAISFNRTETNLLKNTSVQKQKIVKVSNTTGITTPNKAMSPHISSNISPNLNNMNNIAKIKTDRSKMNTFLNSTFNNFKNNLNGATSQVTSQQSTSRKGAYEELASRLKEKLVIEKDVIKNPNILKSSYTYNNTAQNINSNVNTSFKGELQNKGVKNNFAMNKKIDKILNLSKEDIDIKSEDMLNPTMATSNMDSKKSSINKDKKTNSITTNSKCSFINFKKKVSNLEVEGPEDFHYLQVNLKTKLKCMPESKDNSAIYQDVYTNSVKIVKNEVYI